MYNNKKILLVDDDLDSLQLLVKLISSFEENYNIILAKNADFALKIAIGEIPDIIITDWNMPVKNGIDLLKDLKSYRKTKAIPVIMITGFMLDAEDLRLALSSGAIDYIRKPINAVELEARLNSALIIARSFKSLVRQKESENNDNILKLIQGNEFVNTVNSDLEKIIPVNEHQHELIKKIKAEIKNYLNQNAWSKFQNSFDGLHSGFNKKLTNVYPSLSPNELRMCALITIGLSIKSTASLLCLSNDTVKVARYRIRKKLNLKDKENLQTFLLAI